MFVIKEMKSQYQVLALVSMLACTPSAIANNDVAKSNFTDLSKVTVIYSRETVENIKVFQANEDVMASAVTANKPTQDAVETLIVIARKKEESWFRDADNYLWYRAEHYVRYTNSLPDEWTRQGSQEHVQGYAGFVDPPNPPESPEAPPTIN